MKHHIQISEWRGFRILPGKMIPHGVAHKTSANPCASGAMRGEYRKAAHHAGVMRDEISDIVHGSRQTCGCLEFEASGAIGVGWSRGST